MDRSTFAHMAATETMHWWFVGRRSVIDAVLDQIELPQDGTILEAGCGTGGNLATLARRGRITAFDPHIDALAFAQGRYPGVDIRQGALPSELPYDEASFDLVAALDVLEHVEDDRAAAHALVSLVRPGGWLIVTVPAHQALWGTHDRRLHHLRRYGRRQLLDLFAGCDVELVRATSFNIVLSPLAIIYRVGERGLGMDFGNQERNLPEPLNAALGALFRLESVLVRRGVAIPFGLSYAAVFRRRT